MLLCEWLQHGLQEALAPLEEDHVQEGKPDRGVLWRKGCLQLVHSIAADVLSDIVVAYQKYGLYLELLLVLAVADLLRLPLDVGDDADGSQGQDEANHAKEKEGKLEAAHLVEPGGSVWTCIGSSR